MEKSPCESCGIRCRCEKNRGCKEWKEWMLGAWAEVRRIYAAYLRQ